MKYWPIIAFSTLLWLGCDAGQTTPRTSSPDAPTPVAVEPSRLKPEPTPPAEEKKPETELVKAQVGVTGKGQYNDGGGEKATDILTVPISQYFQIQQRIVFDIQVKQAEDFYKANHDNKLPATNEEYMKDVIDENKIVLPKLPDGHKYIYVPEKEQLMVERPKSN